MNENYKEAGVDVEKGYEAVRLMRKHTERTFTKGVLGGIGGFGGLFEPNLANYRNPVMVSGTDGVGTKLKLAFLMDKHDTIGIDCVAMCANDVACSGAQPLFFLDYLAVGKNEPEKVADIVKGVADGCVESGCALIGGETAEMPGFYPVDEYDLAGFCVGIVDKANLVNVDDVNKGDILIGLKSSGVHSNGFSLVRKVFNLNSETASKRLLKYHESLGTTLGEALIAPTKIYVKQILEIKNKMKAHAFAHITGGGFYENIPRMLPKGLKARINRCEVPGLPIFDMISSVASIDEKEMFGIFNMGIGLIAAVPKEMAGMAIDMFGDEAVILGEVVEGEGVEIR